MFAFAEGLLDDINIDSCVIDVGGFGVNVFITARTAMELPGIGEHVKLYTYTSVREDGISLYGFTGSDELNMFKKLITVSGVGPKVALGILSAMDVNSLKLAIYSEDAKAISKAPGVGAKTAGRIVIDLKDKINLNDNDIIDGLKSKGDISPAVKGLDFTSEMEDAVSALASLGYSVTEARKAVMAVDGADKMNSGDILSASLKILY
ncbi:MAG: Holliday junction branch migration protein RuvA [Lachnospiraceae bacterium]|nr:Holliday junction branch migration protein RuvA [Lachnospiraceae bacterium]